MLYTGVAWNEWGYTVAVVDANGQLVRPEIAYPAAQTADMIDDLRGLGQEQPLVVIIESTCGILDGRMMAAGLRVHRADRIQLPPATAFGSAMAMELATLAQHDLSALTRLERDRGTQTGREDDLMAGIAGSEAATQALTAAGRALSHGDRSGTDIALTFDDGPNPPYTNRILDILGRYSIPATFFCVGMNAAAYPAEMARIREQGHELGNHTWSHPFLPELTRKQLAEQIDRTGDSIATASGASAPTLFRPPYGSRSPQVMDWLAESKHTVVLWDVAPDDWAMPGAGVIADSVLAETTGGSIILLHDGGGDRSQTADALPAIVEGALERGLNFTTIDALTAVPK